MSTLRTTAFQLASLALFIGSATQAMAEDITFVSQGGAYQEAQSKAILEPAAKKLGLTLKQDSSPKAYPIIKTQVESGKVTWDVVDLPTGDCIRGEAEGLFEKLDLALIPNAAQIPDSLKDEYSVGYISYSTVLAYRTDAFKGADVPKTWADFWDTKKYPGQRSLRNLPRPTLEIALLADGVPMDKLYPLDVDRAFRKLEQIKPDIATWWTSGGQSAQLISDGEVDMIQAWNGRITAVQAVLLNGILQVFGVDIARNVDVTGAIIRDDISPRHVEVAAGFHLHVTRGVNAGLLRGGCRVISL